MTLCIREMLQLSSGVVGYRGIVSSSKAEDGGTTKLFASCHYAKKEEVVLPTHNPLHPSGSNHSRSKMADRRRRRRRASQDSEDDDESGSGSDSGRSGSPGTKSRGRDPDPPEATATRVEAKNDVESECVSS